MALHAGRIERGQRDVYIDLLRALSLLVVVVWHWAFTILRWRDDGPHATSPLQFTKDLWILTWLFQVVPLFFFVGGFVHLRAWRSRPQGTRFSYARFVGPRLSRLLVPTLALVAVWLAIWALLEMLWGFPGLTRSVRMVLSPLWFIAVYVMLVALAPVMLWLHDRLGVLVPITLAGGALLIDVLRFREGWDDIALANMVLVWAFCHQLGFYYLDVVTGGPRLAAALCWAGLLALVGLNATGLYPASMVGVPGDEISNVSPPTMSIVALCLFQSGLAMVLRPRALRELRKVSWQRLTEVINRFSMPLFLFHSTGMALTYLFYRFVLSYEAPSEPTLMWWLERPLWLAGPFLFTLPVILLFGRRWASAPSTVAVPRG